MANTWLMDNIDSIGSQPVRSVKSSAPIKSNPAPISQPKPVVQDKKYMSGNLMDKAFDVIRTPEYAQTGFVEAGANKAKELGVFTKAPIQALGSISSVLKAGIKAIPEAIKTRKEFGREAGQYNIAEDAGIKNKYAQTGVNFATSLAAPSLALGPVFKGAGKIAQKIPGVTKATEKIAGLGTKMVDFARKTEPIAKKIELFDPFFRSPELKKLVSDAEEKISLRQSKLVNQVIESAKDLTPAEQARIGQMLEGGISSGGSKVKYVQSKLEKIAEPLRKITDDIGKEALDLGLISPETWKNMRGKYMTHIWEQMNKSGDFVSYAKGIIPKGSEQYFKNRKGAEGYIKEFTPAMIKGLGTEIKAIEQAKLYKLIEEKYGVDASKKISATGLSSDLLNTLLKNKPKIRTGLGEVKPGFTTSENIGSELLKTFQEYQPAKGMSKGVVTNLAGGTEKIRKVISPKDSALFAKTIWGNPESQRAYAYTMKSLGYKPTESNLKVFLEKVGTLPGPKQIKTKLDIGKIERQIPEGFGLAPESLTRTKAGKVLKDKALPQNIIDIMEKTMIPKQKGTLDKAYDLWKKGKTIYNVPGYHVRNLVSNQILSDMSTQHGIPRTLFNYAKAVSQYKGKGDQSFVNAAKDIGLIGKQNIGAGLEEAMNVAGYGKSKNVIQKADRALTQFQNASEETSKLNVFTAWVNKLAKESGKAIGDALKDEIILKAAKDKAEEAIFSPYRISKAERGLASKITPFYSFARQAIPFTAKTALNRSATLAKYEKAKTAVEGLTPERKGEFVPEYAKEQIRTPFKDKEGRSYYMNPQFIYPWGNVESATGDISKGQLPFGLSLSPLATVPMEGIFNKQLYTGQQITKSNSKRQQIKDYAKWAAKSIGPTAISSAEKIAGAVTGQEVGGRKRNIPATLLDVAGIKTASFVPEEQQKYQKTNVIYQLKDINSEIRKLKKQKNPDKKVLDELLNKRRELLQVK